MRSNGALNLASLMGIAAAAMTGAGLSARALAGSYGGWSRPAYPGYGWSVARDRRQAKKARNKARNRAAQR